MKRLIAAGLVLALLMPSATMAQSAEAGAAWQELAAKLAPGSDINVRLVNGQRFRATLVAARRDEMALLPKTRKPVPVQSVSYAQIASIEPRRHGGGMGAAKAAAVGAATGAGAFLAMMLIAFAVIDD